MGFFDDITGGSILSPVGSLIGSGIGAAVTASQNKKNRDFTREMFSKENAEYDRRYSQQRQDYLADLASEREYNSAQAQAERLRAAGINPNGASNPVTAGTSSGAQLSGSSLNPGSPIAPVQYDVGGALASGILRASQLDIEQQNAETAQQNAHTLLFRAYSDSVANAARAKNLDADTALKSIDAKYRDAFLSGEVDKIQSEIDMNRQRSFNLLQDSITKMALREPQKQEILSRINQMDASVQSFIADANLKQALTKGEVIKYRGYKVDAAYKAWKLGFEKQIGELKKEIFDSQASIAEKQANWYTAQQYINIAFQTANSVANVANAFKPGVSVNHQGYNIPSDNVDNFGSYWNNF